MFLSELRPFDDLSDLAQQHRPVWMNFDRNLPQVFHDHSRVRPQPAQDTDRTLGLPLHGETAARVAAAGFPCKCASSFARGPAPFEFRGHATGRIEDFAGRDLDPEIGWIDVDPAHRLDQVGLGDDAGATPREFALDPLEDVDLPAGAPQQQRGQEAAHRAADDERTPLGLAHSARSCRFLPRKIAIYRAKPGGMPWP